MMRPKLWFAAGILLLLAVFAALTAGDPAPPVLYAINTTGSPPSPPAALSPSLSTDEPSPALITAAAQVIATTISPLPIAEAGSLTSTPSDSITHTVHPGENLYRIALAYGVPVESVAAANNLTDFTLIFVGQALVIPGGVAPANPLLAAAPTMQVISAPSTAADLGILSPPPLPPLAAPVFVNGIPVESIVVMPDAVRLHVREIYAAGLSLGRNPSAFSKLGDSTIENPHFLARFDQGPYALGDYAYLQAVIDHYRGSFSRQGVAVRRGLHSWSVFDPMWADKFVCGAGETVIACEFRLHNPSAVFVRLGSNDVGVPESFDKNLRQIVEFSIQSGVVPILGTKADRHEGSNQNNDLIRQVAADYRVPLWDFDLAAGTIPGRGLDQDGVHMTTFFAHDWTSPLAFQRGHGIHSLTALMILDAVWRTAV